MKAAVTIVKHKSVLLLQNKLKRQFFFLSQVEIFKKEGEVTPSGTSKTLPLEGILTTTPTAPKI